MQFELTSEADIHYGLQINEQLQKVQGYIHYN